MDIYINMCVYMCVYIYICIMNRTVNRTAVTLGSVTSAQYTYILIGGFLFGWGPHEEPGGRGSSLKNNPNLFKKNWIVFQVGSSCSRWKHGNNPKRKTPWGGKFFEINMYICIYVDVYTYTCIYIYIYAYMVVYLIYVHTYIYIHTVNHTQRA